MDIVYTAHSQPDTYDDNAGKGYYLRARVKDARKIEKYYQNAKEKGATYVWETTDRDLRVNVCGAPASTIQKTADNFQVLDGEINPEKLKTGNYLIYQNAFDYSSTKSEVHAGDKITLTLWDDKKESYTSRDLEVMAVVRLDDPYGRSPFSDFGICLQEKTFREFYSDYSHMVGSVGMDYQTSSGGYQKQREITRILERYAGYQVSMISKYNLEQVYKQERSTMVMIGALFTAFFTVIGITNSINGFAQYVLANKLSYARMQALGMTKRQLAWRLFLDGAVMYGVGVLVYIPLELLLLIFFVKKFQAILFAQSVVWVSLSLLILTAATSWILTAYLNRKTIAERLKETE